jgi:hypothetical protein
MPKSILAILTSLIAWGLASSSICAGAEQRRAAYVGSETCQGCHEAQYSSYLANSKKAKSYGSIQKMQKKLTPAEFKECFKCHTTGYGEPGGFVSAEETPGLKNPGCEVCHGPGSLHAESGDPADLVVQVSMHVCSQCHNSDRVAAYGFKPILYAGAH